MKQPPTVERPFFDWDWRKFSSKYPWKKGWKPPNKGQPISVVIIGGSSETKVVSDCSAKKSDQQQSD